MIVKNESKIIQRCLTEAKPVIDNFSIVDTGSTDNTVELIQEWAKQNNVVGQVVFHPWKNFGYNRSHSFTVGKEYAIQLGYDLPNSYTIFIDADMMLEMLPKFNKQTLKNESYHLEQRTGEFFYHNLRLARLDIDWKCIGVTHEFWSGGSNTRTILDTLKINDIGDGGAKSDKYERDKKYLIDGLVEEPNNTRYFFYLAQTYYHLKEYDNSILWYRKRIDAGGWHEEVWYSYYRVAENYLLKKDPFSALDWCMKAYNFYPARNESLCMLGSFFRRIGYHGLSYHLLDMAIKIPLPPNDVLFIDGAIYKFGTYFEQMYNCKELDKKREGIGHCHRLLKLRELPQQFRQAVFTMIPNFIQPIQAGNIKDMDIIDNLQSGWRVGQGYTLLTDTELLSVNNEGSIVNRKPYQQSQRISEIQFNDKDKYISIQQQNHRILYRNDKVDIPIQSLQPYNGMSNPLLYQINSDVFIDQIEPFRIVKVNNGIKLVHTINEIVYSVERFTNFVSFAGGYIGFISTLLEGKRYLQIVYFNENLKEHVITIPIYILSPNETPLHTYINTVHMKEGKKSITKNNVCLLYFDENRRLKEWSVTPEEMKSMIGKK